MALWCILYSAREANRFHGEILCAQNMLPWHVILNWSFSGEFEDMKNRLLDDYSQGKEYSDAKLFAIIWHGIPKKTCDVIDAEVISKHGNTYMRPWPWLSPCQVMT